MSQPQPYQVNNDGYGQAVYMVNAHGPGVVYAQHVNEFGQSAHVVDYGASGAIPVFFQNVRRPARRNGWPRRPSSSNGNMLRGRRADGVCPGLVGG